MLSAYFDESGSHGDSRVFVLSGLVTPAHQWERFSGEWMKALSNEGITDFHMVDFSHSIGQFKGWEAERSKMFITRLIDIICRRVSFRLWTVIVVNDYRQFVIENSDHMMYTLSAIGCASRLRRIADRRSTYIPCMFEQGGLGGRRALDAFLVQQRRDPDFYRMGALRLGDRRLSPPLQAADLHAYEVYKYFADQLAGSSRPIRRSFSRIMGIREAGGGGYCFTADVIDDFIFRLKAGEHPIELPVMQLNQEHRFSLVPEDVWFTSRSAPPSTTEPAPPRPPAGGSRG